MAATKKPKLSPEERAENRRLKHEADEAGRRAARAAKVAAQPPRLTYGEYMAGAPCPACGMSILPVDGDVHEPVGTMYETPEQRDRRLAEDEAFRRRHPDCNDGRWSVSWSWVSHCLGCCPSPPLSPGQIEKISRILASAAVRHAGATMATPPAKTKPPQKSSKQRVAELEAELTELRAMIAQRG